MLPKLVFTLICDDVREEKSGKLVIVGLYNKSIIFYSSPPSTSPVQESKGADTRSAEVSQQKFGMPKLCFVRRWQVDSPGYKATTVLCQPDGSEFSFGERDLPVPREDYYQEIINTTGIILTPGGYTIRTSVDGKVVHEETFVVRIVSAK